MINYLPKPYGDELAYSLVSRAYAQSGYFHYRYFAKEVFEVSTIRPDFEFLNPYTHKFLSLFTNYKPLADIIFKHTMFPYYARFMPMKKKEEAFNALSAFESKLFYQKLTMNKSKTCDVRYLRYCPLCVKEDRKQFGETYWHRVHQIRHISICPQHLCFLINSNIPITSTASPILITAEACIGDMTVNLCNNVTECRVAKYVAEVFQSPLNLDLDIRIGDHFNSKLIGTPYISRRGEKRYMCQLHQDYLRYYEGVNIYGFNERWHIDKLFSSERYSTYGICLMALFIGISPSDLVDPQIAPISPQNDFDKQIHTLHSQGLNYAQIARQMGASYNVVKAIGEGRYKKHYASTPNTSKGGARRKDWSALDNEMLPKVKVLVEQMTSIGEVRPSKVSVGRVERLLEMKNKQMSNLPRCREYIQEHIISQEEFWAQTVAWGVRQLQTEAKPIHMTNIQSVTNMRKRYVVAALPHLNKYVDNDITVLINGLF